MRQPECYLKEYLDEIQIRYGVRVSNGRFSDILKDLGITHKKVRLCWFLANNSWQRKDYNEIKTSVIPGFERLPGGVLIKSFSRWIRCEFRLRNKNAWMGPKRPHYSVSCSLSESWQLQHPSCNDDQWIYRMWGLFWGCQRRYIQRLCWTSTYLCAMQCRPWTPMDYCHGQCLNTQKWRMFDWWYWLIVDT